MRKKLIATASTAVIVLSSIMLSSCSSTRAYARVDGSYELAPGTTAYYGVGYDDGGRHHRPKKHKQPKPPKPPKKAKHHKPHPKLPHRDKHREHRHND